MRASAASACVGARPRTFQICVPPTHPSLNEASVPPLNVVAEKRKWSGVTNPVTSAGDVLMHHSSRGKAIGIPKTDWYDAAGRHRPPETRCKTMYYIPIASQLDWSDASARYRRQWPRPEVGVWVILHEECCDVNVLPNQTNSAHERWHAGADGVPMHHSNRGTVV